MAKDPYKYFLVEARELLEGLGKGVLVLEKGPSPDASQKMLRLAHTLKGAARVVRQVEIAELAHRAEDLLTAQRDSSRQMTQAEGRELLRLVDDISARVDLIDASMPRPTARAAAADAEETLSTLRVEMRELDRLSVGVDGASVRLGALRSEGVSIERIQQSVQQLLVALEGGGAQGSNAKARTIAEELLAETVGLRRRVQGALEDAEAGMDEVRHSSEQLRLVPANTIFPALERALRDAAEATHKSVEIQASGGDVRIDANVLSALRDALLHVVRNAVVHGIEVEALRRATSKPPRGAVRIEVSRQGHRVAFSCSDDGAGVDVEAVRTAAVARSLIDADAARRLSRDDVMALLRFGGVSTSRRLTELSGRGIGLDVVRATAASLKGELELQSQAGLGTTVRLLVPVSIARIELLMLEVGSEVVGLPLESVRHAARLSESDVARSADGASIVISGRVVPYAPLDVLIGSGRPRFRKLRAAVVVRAGAHEAALGVDRLLGSESVVVRPVPSVARPDPVISGVSLNAEGSFQLVLDPIGLISKAHGARDSGDSPPLVPNKPILVVDDSLTTRMMEQSILESAGYEVDLASSAEEALAKAKARAYGVFIVDVEMPGMDGFAFVKETRVDATLREVPAVLVTSRSSPEDKRRGEQAGASAYVVKGEFDQNRFLQTIRRLAG
ncbi:MAG: response regulator [Deltaproteobacteria bacterium]|nr:response regulator [Deltaproteobacteria bacterium]